MTPVGLIDNEPLDQPIEEEFRAGTITLSWDADDERVVIEVFPVVEVEVELPVEAAEQELIDLPIEEPEPEEVLLVRMTPAMARSSPPGPSRWWRPAGPLPVLRWADGPRRPPVSARQRVPARDLTDLVTRPRDADELLEAASSWCSAGSCRPRTTPS